MRQSFRRAYSPLVADALTKNISGSVHDFLAKLGSGQAAPVQEPTAGVVKLEPGLTNDIKAEVQPEPAAPPEATIAKAEHEQAIWQMTETYETERDELLSEHADETDRLRHQIASLQQACNERSDTSTKLISRQEEYYTKPLSAAEVAPLTFTIEPSEVRLAIPKIQAFLAVRNPKAYELLMLSETQLHEAAGVYGLHDRWLAFSLKQMFNRPCEYTNAFEQLVLGTASMEKQISGHFIFHRLKEPIVAQSGKDKREMYARFLATAYLKPGDSLMLVYASIAKLWSDFDALPEYVVNMPNAATHALIHHFMGVHPTKAEEIEDELVIDEAGGPPFRYSKDQLVTIVAVHTTRATALEVKVFERGGQLRADKEKGRDKDKDKDRGRTRTGGRLLGGKRPCTNCADHPDGGEPFHHPTNCKFKSKCYGPDKAGIPGCPCGLGKPRLCVLKWTKCPDGVKDVCQIDGVTPVPRYMQGWYKDHWETSRKKDGPSVSVVDSNMLFGNRFGELSTVLGEISMFECNLGPDCGPYYDYAVVENDGRIATLTDLIATIPSDVMNSFLIPNMSDAAAANFSATSSENRVACASDIATRIAKAYDESWRRGYASPMAERAFNRAVLCQAVEVTATSVTACGCNVEMGVVCEMHSEPASEIVAFDAAAPNAAIVAVDAAAPDTAIVAVDAAAPDTAIVAFDAAAPNTAIVAFDAAAPNTTIVAFASVASNPADVLTKFNAVFSDFIEVCGIDMHALVEVTSREVNSLSGGAVHEEVLIDGGANTNLIKSAGVRRVAEVVSVRTSNCQGAFQGATSTIDEVVVFDAVFAGNKTVTIEACYLESARRNVLSESYLHDKYNARVLKEPLMVISFDGGVEVPLRRANGLYFVDVRCTSPSTITVGQSELLLVEINAAESNLPYGTAVSGTQRAKLWGARMGVSARNLLKVLGATTGIGLVALDKNQRDAVDADTYNKRSRMRRKYVPTNPKDMSLKPGMLLQVDCFGPVAAPSIVDRAHNQLVAVCGCTGYIYDCTVAAESVDVYLVFLDSLRAKETAIGNVVMRVRFDAAPIFSSPDTERRMERELGKRGLVFEACAGGNHSANGKVEQVQDALERKAEAWMGRQGMGRSYLLPARRYAVDVINACPAQLETKSRCELHHPAGGQPDLTIVPFLLFGTKVTYTTEKGRRGPKGSLDERAPVAQMVGFYKSVSWLLIANNGSVISRAPRDCVPLNELARVEAGSPDAQHDASPPEITEAQPSGGEGAAGAAPTAPPSVFPAPTSYERYAPLSMRGPPSTRLARDRKTPQFYSPAVHALEQLYLSCGGADERIDAFNNLAHSLLQPNEPSIEVCGVEDLRQGLDELIRVCSTRQHFGMELVAPLEINGVEKPKAILVKSARGEYFVTVPKGSKAVERDVNCESWKDADRMAVRVVLSIPDNFLVRKDKVPEGEPIIPCVVARTFKTDKTTGFAHPTRAYYSRLAADGATQAAMLAKRGKLDQLKRPVHAQSVDQTCAFMGLAKAAHLDLEIIALDAPNAYQQGKRTRPGAYVSLPHTISAEYEAADGTPQVIFFGGPIQGEIPAGDEWDLAVNERLIDLGWNNAEGVPALYTIDVGDGIISELHKNVDEFLLLAKKGSPIIAATVDGMNDAWGSNPDLGKMKVEYEAKEWRGYTFQRDRGRGALTIYMSSYLESAVARWIPNMVTDKAARPSANVPKGVSIKDIFGALRLPPKDERDVKLDPMQKDFQSMVGDLVFPSPVLVRCGLPISTLLSVMCYPPRGELIEGHPTVTATFAALLAIEAAFDARFDGITAGGQLESSPRLRADLHAHLDMSASPPLEPEIMGDSTWAAAPFDRYALATTYLGLLIKWQLKVIKTVADCSMGAEMHPTTAGGMQAEYISEVARAQGMPLDDPVVIATDSLANALVSRRQGSTVLVRHLLRRWQALTARIARGLAKVVHLPDVEMPVDFLTKWVTKKKIDASVSYLTNAANRVSHPAE